MTKRMNLLPCPFCGGNDYHVEHFTLAHYPRPLDTLFRIICENCGAGGPAGKRDELLSTWNQAKRRKHERNQ